MITKRTHFGDIYVTRRFFAELIGRTVTDCFGVVEMNPDGAKQRLRDSLPFFPKKERVDKGVSLKINNGKLTVELHITVMYGVNVSTAVNSIRHKIKYVIEEETDIEVERVNVYVEGIKS